MIGSISRTDGTTAVLTTALTLVAGAFFVLAPPAVAQQGQQGTPGVQDIEVSDDELETFAEAHLDVQEIRKEMDQAIQNAEDAESAQAIQQQANREMASVITDEHEMEVERYRNISRAINQDAELQQKFKTILEELTEDEEGGGAR